MSKMRLTVLFGVMAAASLSAFGVTLTDSCAETGSTSFAFSTTASAVLCGDKIFQNFTGSASGTVSITEDSSTSYEVLLRAPTGGISSPFTYGFEVMVDTGVCSNCSITQIQQNMQTTQTGGTGKQIPNGSTGVNTINNGGAFTPGTSDALNAGDQNSLAANLSGTDYTLGFSYNPTGNEGQPAGVFLNLDDIITQSPVPEPMTLSMMGIGLLGLGVMRRRQQGKK